VRRSCAIRGRHRRYLLRPWIFVGAIQAFVFGMLTLVFGVLAVSGHGDEHAEGEAH
jgi:hypothetical protein